MEFLLNPDAQSFALGAALIMFAVGFVMIGLARKFVSDELAVPFGFLIAGLIGIVLGALGSADGGGPVSYTHLTLPTIYSV